MSDKKEKKPRKKGGAGRIIGVVVIVIVLLLVYFPELCFFLGPSQKEALKLFNQTYLGARRRAVSTS